ncbi:hypothetical protein [Cryptosporangium arvum]|uniref:hypothetical protein n=1 Tax=Cryptosporangium arvum TaxID=80871 RepID=UPI001B80CFD3|nr:hypothetical protein [Cryptosporangium arvum]
MARVVMQAVVSADGYIAYPDDTVGSLFEWYGNGDCAVKAHEKWAFDVSRASAEEGLLGRHQGHGDRPSPVRHHRWLGGHTRCR